MYKARRSRRQPACVDGIGPSTDYWDLCGEKKFVIYAYSTRPQIGHNNFSSCSRSGLLVGSDSLRGRRRRCPFRADQRDRRRRRPASNTASAFSAVSSQGRNDDDDGEDDREDDHGHHQAHHALREGHEPFQIYLVSNYLHLMRINNCNTRACYFIQIFNVCQVPTQL